MGDQRGRRGRCPLPEKRPGDAPLRIVYKHYARRDERLNLLTTDDERKKKATETPCLMSKAEALKFAEDFNLTPGLLRREDVLTAFETADDKPTVGGTAGAGAGAGAGGLGADGKRTAGGWNREDELDFDEFAAFLVRCAILAFGDAEEDGGFGGGGASSTSTAADRDARSVDALLKKIRCDGRDSRRLREKLVVVANRGLHNPRDASRDGAAERQKWAKLSKAAEGGPSAAVLARVKRGDFDDAALTRRATRHLGAWARCIDALARPHVLTSNQTSSQSRARMTDTLSLSSTYHRVAAERAEDARWTEFHHVAVDCGTLLPRETRAFRVVVRNRALCGFADVAVEVLGLGDVVEASFAEGPIAAGLRCVLLHTGPHTTALAW